MFRASKVVSKRWTGLKSLLFTVFVEVDPANLTAHLVEANIIETLEASAVDGTDTVVGDEEVLLPSHEYVLALQHVLNKDLAALASLLRERPEGGELGPVRQVVLVAGAPRRVLGLEAVLASDDFALEVGRQGRVVFCQACSATMLVLHWAADCLCDGDACMRQNGGKRGNVNKLTLDP